MVTGRTKRLTDRVKGNVVLGAAQRDDSAGNPTEQYLLLRADENGRLRVISGGDDVVTGRTKGLTDRAVGNVVLLAAQVEDGEGNPTEQYILLRADENGLLRTVGAGAVTFLGLTDTPASYVGQAGLVPTVNVGEDALEFAAGGGASIMPQMDDVGISDPLWTLPGWTADDTEEYTVNTDRLYYCPIYVERPTTFTRIGIHVLGGQPGAARLGIYESDVVGGRQVPGDLVLDAGTVDVTAGGEKSIVINETLAAGFYWLAFVCDDNPDIAVVNNDRGAVPMSGRSETIDNGLEHGSSVGGVGIGALTDPATAADTLQEIDNSALVFLAIG